MPIITPSQAPTPTFILKAKNLEPIIAVQGTRRRRDNKALREPLAKSRSFMVRSLIEEDVHIGRSATMGRYDQKVREKKLVPNPLSIQRSPRQRKKKGVEEKLEKLKEEILAELKSKTRTRTSLRTSSPFVARIQEETIHKNFLMPTMGAIMAQKPQRPCNQQQDFHETTNSF